MSNDTKLRCWRGCLALTDSDEDLKNRGMVVRCLRRTPKYSFAAGGIQWEADPRPGWIVQAQGRLFDHGEDPPSDISAYGDTALNPLSPPESDAPGEDERLAMPLARESTA